jgi:ATP/maltotriose-dependent transcriptional regulator MalT
MHAAAGLLRRGRDTLPADDPARLELVLDLTEVLVEVGDFATAEQILADSWDEALRADDGLRQSEIRLARLLVRYTTDPHGRGDEVLVETERAIAVFEQLDHHVGIAKAWRLVAVVHGSSCRYGEAEHAVGQTILHARAAGDALLEMRNYPAYALIALSGPTPATEAIARCHGLIHDAGGDRRTEGIVLCALAQLQAMEGRFDDARGSYRRAQELLDELGSRVLAASTSLNSGPVEILAGDPAAAERELRRDYELLAGMGERYFLPSVIAFLARAVLEQGRVAEAEELATRCAEMSPLDDLESQAVWRGVRARALVRRGEAVEAERLAREAIEISERTDSPGMRADALIDLAQVLRDSGRRSQADAAAAAALALYEAKGNRVSAGSVRSELSIPV